MRDKDLILAVGVGLLLSLSSCVIHKKVSMAPGLLTGEKPNKLTIVAVQTQKGERIDFKGENKATIEGGNVLFAVPDQNHPERLLWDDIKDHKEDSRGQVTEIETTGGLILRSVSSKKDDRGVDIRGALVYRIIPLSELDLVWVRRTNWGMTIALTTLGTVALAAAAAAAIFSNMEPMVLGESCPFVYSFDGEVYVLDAEPYGGAVFRGLERVEWVGLDNVRLVDGRYRLLLANELEEVEYVDELKLAVVDHPAGVAVVPELSGKMRTIGTPQPPASARDGDGRDVLPLLAGSDGAFWLGRVEGRDPENDEDLKDELILEFAKPAGALSAKLVANTWWTAWGTQAIKPILSAQGRNLGPFIAEINAGGPALFSALGWLAREEMYNLQVRVETAAGWKSKALIFGGGPMIAKDKAYSLDLSDVPGDKVRVKLTPAAGFWMIDSLALDFSADAPVRVTELAANSARDESGRDIGRELVSDDGIYFIIPKGARPATLDFSAPAPAPGLARTLFVKARGYYDLLLKADGEPTQDLEKTLNSPGETIRQALRTHPALNPPSPRVH